MLRSLTLSEGEASSGPLPSTARRIPRSSPRAAGGDLLPSDLETGSGGSGSEARARRLRAMQPHLDKHRSARFRLTVLMPRILYIALFACVVLYAWELMVVVTERCGGGSRSGREAGGGEIREAGVDGLTSRDLLLVANARSAALAALLAHQGDSSSMSAAALAETILTAALAVHLPHPAAGRGLEAGDGALGGVNGALGGELPPGMVVASSAPTSEGAVAGEPQAPSTPRLLLEVAPEGAAPEEPSPPPGFIRLHDGRLADGRLTQQTCYVNGDESELCVYEGAMCFDGEGPVMVVATPANEEVRPLDANNVCMDYRFGETSSFPYAGCRYSDIDYIKGADRFNAAVRRHGTRDYWMEVLTQAEREALEARAAAVNGWAAAEEGERAVALDSAPPDWSRLRGEERLPPDFVSARHIPNSLRVRGLMPPNRRDMFLRSVRGSLVFPDAAAGWDSVAAAEPLSSPHEAYPQLRVRRLVLAPLPGGGQRRVDWMEGGLWLAALQGQATYNPFISAASSVAAMWAAVSGNLSAAVGGARNGAVGGGATFRHLTRHGPALPSIEAIAHSGAGLEEVPTIDKLSPWYNGIQAVAMRAMPAGGAPPTVMWGEVRRLYNRSHLLCARHGFIPSFKPKIMSHMAGAGGFRASAHAHAGVDSPAAAALPRRITVMDRADLGGRSWWNKADILAAARATGLEVAEIPRMDFLSFQQQVAAMASTGILLATHGAHLMNMLFLPRGAIVIEVTPPLLKSPTFASLAAVLGLTYFPVYSRQAVPRDMCHLYAARTQSDAEYIRGCVALNMTGYESLLTSICNRFSKASPLVVPQRALRRVLADAVEAVRLPDTALGTSRCASCPPAEQAAAAQAVSELLTAEDGLLRTSRRAAAAPELAARVAQALVEGDALPAAAAAELQSLLDAHPDLDWTPELAVAWEELARRRLSGPMHTHDKPANI